MPSHWLRTAAPHEDGSPCLALRPPSGGRQAADHARMHRSSHPRPAMRRLPVLLLATFAASCGGSSSTPTPSAPRQASPLAAGAPAPVTAFAQTVADAAGLGEVFPGQANTWVLDRPGN